MCWRQALVIAADIHPIDNLRILRCLKSEIGAEQAANDDWYRHWIAKASSRWSRWLGDGPFLGGDAPNLADICLVPQMYNARRLELPLDDFPKLVRLDAAAQRAAGVRRGAPGRGQGRADRPSRTPSR